MFLPDKFGAGLEHPVALAQGLFRKRSDLRRAALDAEAVHVDDLESAVQVDVPEDDVLKGLSLPCPDVRAVALARADVRERDAVDLRLARS